VIQLLKRKPEPNVLLVSPGYTFASDGNFGIPHLVALGSYIQDRCKAQVTLMDLDYEQALPQPNPAMVFEPHWDVIGISCYSSYEYLKSFYLAVEIRKRNPDVRLVVGGYHPSARPGDFTKADSPFDHVVIGEGELPLQRIVDSVAAGEPRPETPQLMGPELVPDPDALPLFDWSLLARYLPYSRRIGGQVTMLLSRGCPFRCVFCMEAAMGPANWRAYSVERSLLELRRLNEAVDLRGRTLFLTDPLFGVNHRWRREILQKIPDLKLPLERIWALCRADVITNDDIGAFNDAGFGLGFGLESGDPNMLGIIHKGGKPAKYLERFLSLAEHAARIQFPWGANVIAGHPGETPESMRRSADWILRMVKETAGPTGFVSIDPFRFYPGSPIDRNFDHYRETYGTHVHWDRWWDYSERYFTSEWVDASHALPYRERNRLAAEVFRPVSDHLAEHFAYEGTASEYFRRSVDSQVAQWRAPHRMGYLKAYFLWQELKRVGPNDGRTDAEVEELCRERRSETIAGLLDSGLIPKATAQPIIDALIAEPRERYGPPEAVWEQSFKDVPILLQQTEDGPAATISALHAYGRAYHLLDLQAGDRLLDAGAGTGYGTAVAARVVGDTGRVTGVEFDQDLVNRASELLADCANTEVICGAVTPEHVGEANKVVFGFSLQALPLDFLATLGPDGRLVAPVWTPESGAYHLFLWTHDAASGGWVASDHGPVHYVGDRAHPQPRATPATPAST